jgi:hypothetical protein
MEAKPEQPSADQPSVTERVTLPLLFGKGKPGPLCPDTETPYDLVFD